MPGFLYHFFLLFSPQHARSWTLLRTKRFYCCFWNRLNKFSTLESITSSQFALGVALLVRYTGRTEVLNKKGQISTKPTMYRFRSELNPSVFVFPINLIFGLSLLFGKICKINSANSNTNWRFLFKWDILTRQQSWTLSSHNRLRKQSIVNF